jgi:hypothetical protein
MTIDSTVNVQELQRLNEAITLTLDAVRRVAPQLAQLQAMTYAHTLQPNIGGYGMFGSPFGVGGIGATLPTLGFGGVSPFGVGVDPFSGYLQAHAQALRAAMMQSSSPLTGMMGHGQFGTMGQTGWGSIPHHWQNGNIGVGQPFAFGQRL